MEDANFHNIEPNSIELISTPTTVLMKLPVFCGNRRNNDTYFKSGPDCRTFLRSIDNYIVQNKITENDEKVRIFFSQICKDYGTAITIANLFAGKRPEYEDVKLTFLDHFPCLAGQDFKQIADSIKNIENIDQPSTSEGVANLINNIRVGIEEYVNRDSEKLLGIDENITFKTNTGKVIQLTEYINKTISHFYLAAMLNKTTYERLKKIPSDVTLERFSGQIVKNLETAILLGEMKPSKPRQPPSNEILYAVNHKENDKIVKFNESPTTIGKQRNYRDKSNEGRQTTHRDNSGTRRRNDYRDSSGNRRFAEYRDNSGSRRNINYRDNSGGNRYNDYKRNYGHRDNSGNRYGKIKFCHNCRERGHTTEECYSNRQSRTRSRCRICYRGNHVTSECYKKLNENKFCTYCKRKYHTLEECRTRVKHRNELRMINTETIDLGSEELEGGTKTD